MGRRTVGDAETIFARTRRRLADLLGVRQHERRLVDLEGYAVGEGVATTREFVSEGESG
jgi:hypothetical protein